MSYQVARQKLIYVFGIPDSEHRGLLKIGETTLTGNDLEAAANKRIREYTRTAGIYFKLLHTELAVDQNGKTFSDTDVHNQLERSGIKKTPPNNTTAREWFRVDLQTVKRAIAAVKQGKHFIHRKKIREEIILRPEQEEAVSKTVAYFAHGKEFLWNAKMRFGKTICALEVVRRMNFTKTIIITHRPVVDENWFEDFDKIFGDDKNFSYGSKNHGSTLNELLADKKNFVYFASIQDLRGSEIVGGNIKKNTLLFKTKWDCVIVDEAHEGTQTELGENVFKMLVKPNSKVLKLSGTPFNIISDFDSDNVYTWNYVDEQRAKAEFAEKYPLDYNPYAELPQMNILTYDLGDILQKFYLDDEEEIAFSFREFFNTDGGRFVHEDDVKSFLDLLVKRDDNNYPFSRPEWREQFRHTFWIVPGVEAARELSKLLQHHKVFHAFKIVNVAGDGDGGKVEDIEIVHDAIRENDYTITLSCGRFTTGVTVPEWSAVFILTGSNGDNSKTSAMSYMQTIFRVQSPCDKGGVVKTNCYVFDFAPDRTLKVIAESLKISARAGNISSTDKELVADFVKFCPVIAVEGSRMNPINANNLMQKLKRAQAERVVRNGFEDNYLYDNDKLLTLTDEDLPDFSTLNAIIGSSKAQKKSADVVVNNQGLSPTERKQLGKELNREPTPEELEARRRRKLRDAAISNLRGLSIRMPLLIYGADVPFDDDISIDKFAELIDDASWAEFMPKGITKELFAKFIQYYDKDVFIAAGRRIRNFAKRADELKPTARVKKLAEIFATFKNPDKETVLTPWRVVNLHLSAVFGGYDFFDETHTDILDNPRQIPTTLFTPDKKILEINSKTGLYPLYVAYSIYRARLAELKLDEVNYDFERLYRLWDMTVAENVFVICKTPMAEKITRRTLGGYRDGTVNARCYDNLITELKNIPSRFIDRITEKSFWDKGDGKMFFHGVVGNPPYQTAGSGDNKTYASPVYHLFIQTAYNKNLTENASLIHPARFLSNAGATPGDFAEKFLNDPHVNVNKYYPNGQELFPTSDIKGGIAITEFDATKKLGPIGTHIPFKELESIHQKVVVDNPNFQPLSKIMYSRTAYSLTPKAHKDFPNAIKNFSKGNQYQVSSNVFDLMPEIFFDAKPNDGHEYIQLYGRKNNERVFKWVRRDYVTYHESLEKFKVFVPDSNGSGALGEVVSTPLVGSPLVGSPLVGSTQTFISVGAFDTRAEADACIAYIKSKFCRVMLGILKVTQHNPPATWSKVPLQDFSSASDIDWSVSIAEIDAQLYRKYKLSDDEIKFIESKVKAMT